ncbi:MAG: hypothetical protein A2Y33_15725 [Spirochaetes bacterium GWF1_51_8]|nr:MAG: hypothetical protein A2Y33_15725 [Spirochaetes bacterium GWF1_51_8]
MKRLILIALLFVNGVMFAGGPSGTYIPAEVELPLSSAEGKGADYIMPRFYPVGWSKDGKFAYFTYSSFEYNGTANTIFKFVIQNLIDDKLVWETTFAKGKEVSLAEVWAKYENEINAKLAQNKISQYEGELGKFPFKTAKGAVDYEVRVTQKKSSLGYTYIDSIEFHAFLGKTGDKIIYKEKNSQAIRLSVPGFMKSPFEDRVAIVLLKVKRSDEEGLYPVEIQIIGCHLGIGFKQTKPSGDDEDEDVEPDYDPDADEFEIEIDEDFGETDGNF